MTVCHLDLSKFTIRYVNVIVSVIAGQTRRNVVSSLRCCLSFTRAWLLAAVMQCEDVEAVCIFLCELLGNSRIRGGSGGGASPHARKEVRYGKGCVPLHI